ncbi:MAG: hypothetical protein HDR92_06875 [Bacteroides sp.]|nr:hypothetical protein [Bacteroides sp.]
MNLNKGDRLTLDVVADSYGYYTVNLEGSYIKVKKFDFQRYDKTPERLRCIVDRADGTTIFLKQDMAPIFAARYKPGESYEFIVEADKTMTDLPHYRVTQEGVGYWIMLPARRNMKLSHGDRVRCRVGKIQGINLNLHIEEVLDRHGEPPMVLVKPTELAAHAGEEAYSSLMETLTEEPRMIKARQMLKARNPEWVLEALRAGREYILATGHAPEAGNVSTLRAVAAYILEDSQLLGAFPAQRRIALREEIARLVSHCDDMITALEIVGAGHQSEYISDMMAKLSASGYLYRPESKLRTLMCVFSLDPDSIDAKMTELISIIHKGNVASWLAEPFCSAFVEQLQLYIDSCHTILDNISDIDGDEAESRLDKMLSAIAIQQILASARTGTSSADAADELAVNRSRLYRYFSFKGTCSKTQMVEKALQVAVTGDIPDNEFSWDDTKELGRLARKLVSNQPLDNSKYVFTAPNASLSVSSGSIDLRIKGPEASHPVIPPRLELWHGIQVWLDEALPADRRHPSTILQFRDSYALVRKALCADSSSSPAASPAEKSKARKLRGPELTERKERVRMLPDPGDLVDIIVEPVSPGVPDAERFTCRVVEDGFRGKGYLDHSNITRGKGMLPLSAFFDENNRPYRLRARVMACSPNDTLSFSIIDELNRYINANVELGTELNGVVIGAPTVDNGFGAGLFTVLTEHGYTVWTNGGEFTDDLHIGQTITLRIDGVGSGGRADIMGTCIRSRVPECITFEDAFSTLIYSYADGQVYEPGQTDTNILWSAGKDSDDIEDSAGQMDEPLSDTRVGELMLIIARLADLETDMVKAYNYFCFARLLADILDLEQQSLYYARRCSIIEVLDEFASNGRVDLARVDSLSEMIIESASSSIEAQKLKLLAALDRPDRSDKVWDVVRSTASVQIEKLGRLILAYNALDGFKLGKERSAIREQIYNELHLVPDTLPEQIEGGREGQKVEFKTSLIYPAGNFMRRDVRRQTREILQVIAGFINTSGGRLYIGVSDEGYVRGVSQDLEFFKSLDKMDLHLMNAIDKYFKMVDRFRFIQSSWQEYDGKMVYVIDVRPSRIPVALEGVYFQRHGSSTRHVPAELEARFLQMRRDSSIEIDFAQPFVPAQPQAPVAAEVSQTVATALPAPEPAKAPVDVAVGPAPGQEPEGVRDTAELPEVPATDARRKSDPAPDSDLISTSERRDNRHYDTCDGTPFHEPVSFFYVTDADGNYRISPDPLWIDEESRLTLRLREDEAEGDLLVVFKSGHGIRLDYQRLEPQGRISGGEIAFVTPARPVDGLFVYYSTDDGRNVYKRFFSAESLRRGSVYEQGERLLSADSQFLRAIVIEPERAAAFARYERNGQRISGGLADLDDDYTRTLSYHLK